MEEIRNDTAASRGKLQNGNAKINGAHANRAAAEENLAIPQEIVVESMRLTKECLDGVVEIVK